ncbi:MAG: ketoacyl-ACP synthase III, partial [Ignavibacteria bacterium]
MNYYIKAVEYFLPDKILDNDALSVKWNISSEFIESRVGIKERHISSENEPTSVLAFNAVSKILKSGKVTENEIDILIVCTQNPDYRLPMVSSLLHSMLNLKRECICFDINLGCSGFVYSLPIVGNFLKLNMAKNAVLVMADEYSKIINYDEKNTAALFGDAASAILVSQCKDEYGVLDFQLYSDGKRADSLIAYNSGVCIKQKKESYLSMKARDIYKFSTTEVPISINELLNKRHVK